MKRCLLRSPVKDPCKVEPAKIPVWERSHHNPNPSWGALTVMDAGGGRLLFLWGRGHG